MEHTHISIHRKLLLTWLILPAIIIWFTTNYLIGILRPPDWKDTKKADAYVLGTETRLKETYVIPTIAQYTWQGTGLITLWFDDGWLSQYTVASPMLDEFGLKAALAVPTHLIGFDAYMGWAQVRRLQSKGWEITSHTRTHDCTMYQASEKTLESELAGAQSDLKQMGLRSDNFVSPCGVSSPLMKSIAEKYYTSYRGSETGFNDIPVTVPFNLTVQAVENTVTVDNVISWIQTAKDQHKWLILMFHQIDGSHSKYSITPKMLNSILQEVQKSGVPVVLPEQVLELQGINHNIQNIATDSAVIKPSTQDIQIEIHE